MQKVLYILICCLLFSCNEKKETEVIDLTEVLPSSERYAEDKLVVADTLVVSYFDSLSTFAQRLTAEFAIKNESVEIIDSLWLPDRFDNSGVEKWSGQTEQGKVILASFKFKDSLSMKNSLFNWFDCFGRSCNSIQLLEKKKIKSDPFLIFAMEKEIFYFSTELLKEKQLLNQVQGLYRNKAPMFVLSQSSGRDCKWWSLEGRKWVEIKKEEL